MILLINLVPRAFQGLPNFKRKALGTRLTFDCLQSDVDQMHRDPIMRDPLQLLRATTSCSVHERPFKIVMMRMK